MPVPIAALMAAQAGAGALSAGTSYMGGQAQARAQRRAGRQQQKMAELNVELARAQGAEQAAEQSRALTSTLSSLRALSAGRGVAGNSPGVAAIERSREEAAADNMEAIRQQTDAQALQYRLQGLEARRRAISGANMAETMGLLQAGSTAAETGASMARTG